MVEDIVRSFGFLTLGTRMKRIGERLQADTQRIIDEAGLPIQAAQYPYLAAIDRQGPLTIGELTMAVGISQPGVTRTVAQLAAQGLLEVRQAPGDQRRRTVALTPDGRQLVEFSKQHIWPRIEAAVKDLCKDLSGPLLPQLAAIEQGLAATPLDRRATKIEEKVA
ncbi:MarR family transcriptional regulator [Mesorhizobium sp. LHD-90]|uniref:MarR family winged helix-turn-helix transcriptional regulator n=1 Tax=Mesorhizobium sp. LHD-90 TaxID=3071414 RepID=UPI0027E13C54|nr:MarR family transcriptional regulator [Mesorhizobium sp. LHD-90]MDQ6433360.1 MarR family transcriptional regulator [Mesorhizobium sp. LHD-90]